MHLIKARLCHPYFIHSITTIGEVKLFSHKWVPKRWLSQTSQNVNLTLFHKNLAQNGSRKQLIIFPVFQISPDKPDTMATTISTTDSPAAVKQVTLVRKQVSKRITKQTSYQNKNKTFFSLINYIVKPDMEYLNILVWTLNALIYIEVVN